MTIRSLNINLNANIGGFMKGMDRAIRKVRKFGSVVSSIGLTLVGFAAALVAGAVAGMTLLVRNAMKAIDVTAKLADRIGMTTEAIQRFKYAASIMGITEQGLIKALEQFTRRVTDAKAGTGEYAQALGKLNLEAKNLARMPVSEAILRVAERMKKLASYAERVDVAYQLFGRTGMKMVNLLALGRKGIEELGREAEQFGLTLSRWDAAKVVAANRAFKRLRAATKGLATQIAVQLAPLMEWVANSFRAWTASADGTANAVGRAMQHMIDAVGKVADAMELIPVAFVNATATIYDAVADQLARGGPFDKLMKGMAAWSLRLVLIGPKARMAIAEWFWNLTAEGEKQAQQLRAKAAMLRFGAMGMFGARLPSERIKDWFDQISKALEITLGPGLTLANLAAATGAAGRGARPPGLAGAAGRGSLAAYSAVARAQADAQQRIAMQEVRELKAVNAKVAQLLQTIREMAPIGPFGVLPGI